MISFNSYDDVIRLVYENNQEHVFAYWNELTDDQKKILLTELADIDFHLLKKLFTEHQNVNTMDYKPAPYIPVPKSEGEKTKYAEARAAGEKHIRDGKVAAFLVAGGQGSRLGYEGPKGMYPVGQVSGKTLFQIHAEKLVKYSRKYDVRIPWLIMTSNINHDETVSYLKEKDYFGLREDDVIIFSQNMIPSIDLNGKLILETKNSIFKNPDGHGGSLTALATSGTLEILKTKGIETISYFQVDNPLVKIVDPVFIGFHVLQGAGISSKALKKAYPEEKVGVFVEFSNSRIGVIEYSDLPHDKTYLTDSSGNFQFSSGSIAIHIFSRSFIEKITTGNEISLPFHTARKKIKAYSGNGSKEIEGFKFEKFVFDSLTLTEKNVVFETIREEEFAPVKNAEGIDSVVTAQQLMSDLIKKWLIERRIVIPKNVQVIEISPLIAVEPDDLPDCLIIPKAEKVYLE